MPSLDAFGSHSDLPTPDGELPAKPEADFDWGELDQRVANTIQWLTESPRPKKGFTRPMFMEHYKYTKREATTKINSMLRRGVIVPIGTVSVLKKDGHGGVNYTIYDFADEAHQDMMIGERHAAERPVGSHPENTTRRGASKSRR